MTGRGDNSTFNCYLRIAVYIAEVLVTYRAMPVFDVTIFGASCRTCFDMLKFVCMNRTARQSYSLPSCDVSKKRDSVFVVDLVITIDINGIKININIPPSNITKQKYGVFVVYDFVFVDISRYSVINRNTSVFNIEGYIVIIPVEYIIFRMCDCNVCRIIIRRFS